MKKRFLTMLLALVMVFSLFPTTALAGWGYGAGKHSTGKRETKTHAVEWKGDKKTGTSGLKVKVTGADISKEIGLSVEILGEDEAAQYFAAIKAAGRTLVNPIALNITLLKYGKEYQPTSDVQLSITRSGVTLSDTVYHFEDAKEEADEEADEEVQPSIKSVPGLRGSKSSVGDDDESDDVYEIDKDTDASVVPALKFKTLTSSTSGDTATVTTNHFSVYVISEGEEVVTPTITFEFYDGQGDANNGLGNPYEFENTSGQTVTSQIIKNGEKLQPVPAPGLDANNNAFNGWFYADGDKVGQEVDFDEAISVTETKTVKIVANYGDVIYVTFWQYAAGKVVLERKQVAKTDGKYTFDIATVSVPAPKTTLKFMGWSLARGTDASEEEGDEVGSRALLTEAATENDNNDKTTIVAFTGNTDVYPVYYSGLWVTFQSAAVGAGASYREPYFLAADSANASAAEPEDPTMTGYQFDGWYTEEEFNADYDKTEAESPHGEEFDFSTAFANLTAYTNDRDEIELYGHWSPGQTTYTVVYWKQQVTDSKDLTDDTLKKYDYAGQENPQEATTGAAVTPKDSEKQKAGTGFTYKRYTLTDKNGNAIDGIAPDGSSILNVYFDRQTITMRFYKAAGTITTGWAGQQITPPRNYDDSRWTNATYADTYTGLYGQTWAQAGYTGWPSPGNGYAWFYFNGSNGYTGLSTLGQFVLDLDTRDTTKQEIRLFKIQQTLNTIYFYQQNLDGTTYPDNTQLTGVVGSGGFTFSDKYNGFVIVQYRLGNGSWQTVSSQRNADGTHTYTPSGIDRVGSNNLHIRLAREKFEIKYLNPLNEREVLTAKELPFGASLESAEPSASETVNLNIPGYEWNGKWYKDRACTQEFKFDEETMPLDGTKVYAGSDAIYYYVKFDPNGGQLLSGQRTYSWFLYNQECNTYDTIERNYIEYTGHNGPYYYYYDEFEIDRRDDIWNYLYMAANPRTTYYTDQAVPDDWVDGQGNSHSGSEAQAWLDTTTQYSYEADAYALIGWYDVTDGVDGAKPFLTGSKITRDTVLQAFWRRTGEYGVNYSVEAVDETGAPLLADEQRVMCNAVPSDTATYADQSDSAIMDKATVPADYSFVGWWYDGKLYEPGDVFQVQAKYAVNKVVYIYPVLEKVETLPVAVTDITFNANGGVFNTTAAETEINAMIAEAMAGEPERSTYKPTLVKNEDGTWTVKDLKINEGFDVLSAAAVEMGVTINGEMVPGRGYRLKEWNTAADGTGDHFALGVRAGVDQDDPTPNTLYAIWEPVFYVYHTATSSFETVAVTRGTTIDRWTLTTGYDPTNKKYTDYYYGGYSVYAAGSAEASDLTFKAGNVDSGTIAPLTRKTLATNETAWNPSDTGAVYVIREVSTAYLAQPKAITIRDNYGNGSVTALHFLSVTDSNLYRSAGIKLKGTDCRGMFAKNFTLQQNGGSSQTLNAQSLYGMDGYLTIVSKGTKTGEYTSCQAYWITYDNVTVYGIEANIRDITID